MTDPTKLNLYCAMAHKGKLRGETYPVEASDLWRAKVEAARIAGTKTEHVSIQLQRLHDGTQVTGAIL